MSDQALRIQHRYVSRASAGHVTDDAFTLAIATDAERSKASATLLVKQPDVVRDVMSTLVEITASDLRRRAQNRADYLAYLAKQGKAASGQLWEAQKAFLEAELGEGEDADAAAQGPLDPVLDIASDGVGIEVFSADESMYARAFFRRGEAFDDEAYRLGTTHLALTNDLPGELRGMRSYRSARLELAPDEGAAASTRTVDVPYRWVRALAQTQSAATLPATDVELAPVDLYNVLLSLRSMRAKRSPRALRFELVPGEPPRLVLEPWEKVLTSTAEPFAGSTPRVVRTWGRRRLMTLQRLLPHAERLRIRLLGGGMPAFYILDLPGVSFVAAMSGWTDSGWAGIGSFDLMTVDSDDQLLPRHVVRSLADDGPTDLSGLAARLPSDEPAIRNAVSAELQRGRLLFDVATGQYRYRDLFVEPIDPERLRYRDEREEDAHRLLDLEGAVTITKVHDLGAEGMRIEGTVNDPQAHRHYETSFTLDREGRTVDASCSSPQFRRSGLKEGPTVPMIALRLAYAQQKAALEEARRTPEGRQRIVAETRTFVRRAKRDMSSEHYRLSLDERQVVMRWGPRPEQMRMQRVFFTTADEARNDYFNRLDRLASQGFIDATAAEAV